MSKKIKTSILKRKTISLAEKIEILDRLQQGAGPTAVGKLFGLNDGTVRTIKKNEVKIRSYVADGCLTSVNKVSKTRDPIMMTMEKRLKLFIDESNSNNIPWNSTLIKQKALEIFNDLSENRQQLPEIHSSCDQNNCPKKIQGFSASKGWYENFKKRFSLNSGSSKNVSANHDRAKKEYPEEKVFQVHGLELFTRHLPQCSNTYKIEREQVHSTNGGELEDMQFNNSSLLEQHLCIDGMANLIDTGDFCTDIRKLNQSQIPSKNQISAMTLQSLCEGIKLAEYFENFFLNIDPCPERSAKFKSDFQNAMAPYRELYEEMERNRKQPLITSFMIPIKKGSNVQRLSKNNHLI